MRSWRSLGVWIAVLTLLRPAAAQTKHALSETLQPNDCFQLQLEMKLTGEMRINRNGQQVPLPLTASAQLEYPERILLVDAGGLPQKVARHYDKARSDIKVDGHASARTLRPERRLIVAQQTKERFLTYCPNGALTGEELELTCDQFNTLVLTGLLPGKEVAVGESWKLANPVAQTLCDFEGLINQDLTATLESVQGADARIKISGTASGIDAGSLIKLTVQAACRYDLASHRLTEVAWKQQDEREQGPVSPASTMEITWTVKRTALSEQPRTVSDVALIKVPEGSNEPPAPFLLLSYRDPQDRFTLHHGRDWQLVGQTGQHTILRLMDRGNFVAQVTITPWDMAEPGKHLSAEKFKVALDDTPGWEPEEIREDGEVQSAKGHWVYRVSALGDMDDIKVLQNFYLVAGAQGNQVVLAFTLRPALADKLGTRDLELVNGVDFPKTEPDPAKKP